ncbi:winged helix-turn-helix domain-containing protein [Bdellovibrio sp. HCB209]|uniref:winged helix-turn-helix domain-containing protein n=1 Tax=Bdellovibrio sp. HCB209 TaxID=3394354 RepID=UPI0039B560F4
MLADLFGSQTTEKSLLLVAALGESYALEIAKTFQISKTQVARTLLKLEQADILIGQDKGRTRVYTLNKGWVLFKELNALLQKALSNVPLDQQEQYFMKRMRPRKKNKAL